MTSPPDSHDPESLQSDSSKYPEYTVKIRYRTGGGIDEICFTTNDRAFYPLTQKWRYVVVNRQRFTSETRDGISEELLDRLYEVACQRVPEVDVEAAKRNLRLKVQSMARSGVVEVEIPYSSEAVGWAARLFPWESVLGLLTRPHRGDLTITVVRFLAAVDRQFVPTDGPTRALVVRSGPGQIGTMFNLQRECALVVDTLGTDVGIDPVLCEPDRAALVQAINDHAAQAQSRLVIHLAGVDPVSLEEYGLIDELPKERDGFVLRGKDKLYDCVPPVELAKLLNGSVNKPALVAISSCFSASRLAAMAVAFGSRYAIGFQDTITDDDAIMFFSVFYRHLAQSASWDVLAAFDEARIQFSSQASSPGGGGVVLWTEHSLLQLPVPKAVSSKTTNLTNTGKSPSPEDLKLFIEATPSLNYSLLHNNRSLFKSFVVVKPFAGKLPPLRVEVVLEAGEEACRCRFAESLPENESTLKLVDKIRLPLNARLLRQCTEGLRTNLYIRAECGGKLLYERSDRVTVLPADEWRDDGTDHQWLPSFVLPRDPAVLRIVIAAQRYLRTLLDDCYAGFDGYQQVRSDEQAADVVDPQVQAIWAALQHDFPLSYINPPPSYSSQSQRLRTPSQIFQGQVATCIDSALLFASCMEYIGIYPVVFLISGHAFPGYWRSDHAWWNMMQFKFPRSTKSNSSVSSPTESQVAISQGQGEGWLFAGTDHLSELLRYMQDGTLVPFESTFVTAKRGFSESLEAGLSNLRPETFDAMIDVQCARGADVTPLPLLG